LVKNEMAGRDAWSPAKSWPGTYLHVARASNLLDSTCGALCEAQTPFDRSMIQEEFAMGIIWFLIVGLIAGWLAGVLVKGGGFGLIGDMVVGVIGAFVGGFLFSNLGVSAGGGLIGSIVVATIGAVVLLFVIRLIKKA
jgi:uncharacterized membrane protein YeaQ/YmgE (transglycosylase-associated protein family)